MAMLNCFCGNKFYKSVATVAPNKAPLLPEDVPIVDGHFVQLSRNSKNGTLQYGSSSSTTVVGGRASAGTASSRASTSASSRNGAFEQPSAVPSYAAAVRRVPPNPRADQPHPKSELPYPKIAKARQVQTHYRADPIPKKIVNLDRLMVRLQLPWRCQRDPDQPAAGRAYGRSPQMGMAAYAGSPGPGRAVQAQGL